MYQPHRFISGAGPANCPTSRSAKPFALKKATCMKHITLIILLASCSPMYNSTITGTAIEVVKDGYNKYTMKLDIGTDTVTVKYGTDRKPKTGNRYKVDYDSTKGFPKQAHITPIKTLIP
jgi:hypothetical protein